MVVFMKDVLVLFASKSDKDSFNHILKILDEEKTLHNVLNRTENIRDAIHSFENFDVLPASIFTTTKINPFDMKKKTPVIDT